MKPVALLLICLIALPMSAGADQLYRWFDENGKVHYGDAPPASAANVERRAIPDVQEQGEELSFATRRARQNFPVTLYVGAGCVAACEQAQSLLSKRGIPHNEVSLQTTKEVEEFKQQSGTDRVPVLLVGKTYLRGFLAEQWQSELDIAGYPRTASYRQRLAAPAANGQPAVEQTPNEPAAQ
ncbi:MAG: glutaredoxin family protein [Nitrosomonadales bacterium]|nr:glutaredoxin family protein [Nitrosomonadales bacterium]